MSAIRMRLLFLLFLAAHLTACSFTGGPVSGRVLESGTKKPIADAIVVASWRGQQGYSGTVCYHVETAKTDAKGKFAIPVWFSFRKWSMRSAPQMTLDVYKQGLVWEGQQDSAVFMGTAPAETRKRFEYLAGFSGLQCGVPENYVKELIPLYEAIYAEAKAIARTREDRRQLIHRLRDLEEMRLGPEQADKNWEKRELELNEKATIARPIGTGGIWSSER